MFLAGDLFSQPYAGVQTILAVEVCYVALLDKEQCRHLLLDTHQLRAQGFMYETAVDDAIKGQLKVESGDSLLTLCACMAAICTQACNKP